MSDQQLTDWFPGYMKPARVGEYEHQSRGRNSNREWMPWGRHVARRLWWNGERWLFRKGGDESLYQPFADGGEDFRWRGLASDPAKPERKPREWLRWATVMKETGEATWFCESRREARNLRDPDESVIRVRITEVL